MKAAVRTTRPITLRAKLAGRAVCGKTACTVPKGRGWKRAEADSAPRQSLTRQNVFQSLTVMFQGELDTLGYPRAALLGFAVALAAYNVLSTVQAALRGAFGAEKIQQEVSSFYIALEVRVHHKGMAIALGTETWTQFQSMPPALFARAMLRFAKHVNLRILRRHPRGPKKPVPKRTRFADKTHVSTARLLAEARRKRP